MTGGLEDDIRYTLGSIEGKVDLLVEQGRIQDDRAVELEARLNTRHNDLERRVRSVENRQHWYAGVAAALSATATYLIKGWTGH